MTSRVFHRSDVRFREYGVEGVLGHEILCIHA
jgi:hypothetical protein